MIAIGLLLPVGGYIAIVNLKSFAAGAMVESQVSVFLATKNPETAGTETSRANIEARLRREPGVQAFRFVGRETALQELQSRIGAADLLAGLADNPLPDTFVVTPRERSAIAERRLADSIRAWPGVAEVNVDSIWTERIRLLVGTAELLIVGLGVLLGIAVLAITFNTIRLQVLTRSEQIAVYRLFGATSAHVRRPFIYFGAFQGALAALIAWAIAAGVMVWIEPRLATLLQAYGLPGNLAGLTSTDGLALVGFTGAVGATGAWLASAEF
ncbi:MAG: permease-like cell division protein FtsX [Betaproteobacteria bacterium]